MYIEQNVELLYETLEIASEPLKRAVRTDIYSINLTDESKEFDLLLFNDGQDLATMNFANILEQVNTKQHLRPLVIAAIHCCHDRLNEYGTVVAADYEGRGAKAGAYESFIISELLPALSLRLAEFSVREISFAGFSLGGLSAIDIVWRNPEIFTKAGVFSGSFWWRTKCHLAKGYNPNTDRIIHNQIREGKFQSNLKFFFECGSQDETCDRNRNGVIDTIDDTIDLMRELLRKGYKEGKDFVYMQITKGKHDIKTWAQAMPAFLLWGWSKETTLEHHEVINPS